MAKKIKYQSSEKRFIWLEVESDEEITLIKELNQDMERIKKRDRIDRQRNISMDYLFEEHDFEFPSDEPAIIDVLIEEERNYLIREAVNKLPARQKFVIIEFFWKNKSLRDIAKEYNIHLSSVAELYHKAMLKLEKWLKDLCD